MTISDELMKYFDACQCIVVKYNALMIVTDILYSAIPYLT